MSANSEVGRNETRGIMSYVSFSLPRNREVALVEKSRPKITLSCFFTLTFILFVCLF